MGDHTSFWLGNDTAWFTAGPPLTVAPAEDPAAEALDYDAVEKLGLILPRLTAVISMLAVLCVATEAWKDLSCKDNSHVSIRRGTTASQNVATISYIQFFYQIPLFCHALVFLLGTTPVPEEQGVWGAAGNTATCTLQGLLLQFALFGALGWDATLSTSYLLMVRYNVDGFRLQKWERYLHFLVWPFSLVLSLYPLYKGMYNFNHNVCWLESLPTNCELTGEECIRGAGANLWQTIASFAAMIHMAYSITVVAILYCSIRGLEDAGQQQRDNKLTATTNRRYSRAVGIQGMLYASGILLTTLPSVLYIVMANIAGVWGRGVGIFATSMHPLLGYVNFVVFMRGRSLEDCHTGYSRFLRRIHGVFFDRSFICSCCFGCGKNTRPAKHDPKDDKGNTASTTSKDPCQQDGKETTPTYKGSDNPKPPAPTLVSISEDEFKDEAASSAVSEEPEKNDAMDVESYGSRRAGLREEGLARSLSGTVDEVLREAGFL